jgi:hypothetical protein
MHSKTEAQELQAISKAVKKQQTEQKKKVGYFLLQKVIFSVLYVMLQQM